MQFTLLQHGEDINASHGIIVLIEHDEQWQKWYKEIEDRHFYNSMQKYAINYVRTFDTDEAQECGVIGIEHLTECLKFLANK